MGAFLTNFCGCRSPRSLKGRDWLHMGFIPTLGIEPLESRIFGASSAFSCFCGKQNKRANISD
jgi:hypothetical protein